MNTIYKKIDKDLINRLSNCLKSKQTSSNYTLYTGWLGMVLFDLAMLGLTISVPYYTVYAPKRGKYNYVFSLFSKNGTVKAYVNKRHMFEIKNGTELLFTTNNLDKFTFEKLKNYDR